LQSHFSPPGPLTDIFHGSRLPFRGTATMENKVNAKIKELINLVYGKTFSEAHLHVLLENIEKPPLLLRKSVKWAGMKKMSF
jgi:hypothetical protein